MVKIAFVTPEHGILARRTSLADLAEALPAALCEVGCDVRVFLPWSLDIESDHLEGMEHLGCFEVGSNRDRYSFDVHRGTMNGLTFYLLDQESLFAPKHTYGSEEGPYPDNWLRYAYFSRAVLECLEFVNFRPDVIHCVDWTTGLLPVYRELEYVHKRPDHPAAKAGTFFGVHNLAMQGEFEREILSRIGLPHSIFQCNGGIELGGKVNFLKAGAEFSTILGTHSPGHARRIQAQDRGYGLEDTFARRNKELIGIQNGVDYRAWDPSGDPLLPQTYSADDEDLGGKRRCKTAMQSALRLDNGPRTPVAAMIGRFDADSGFDLLAQMLTPILERNIEVILMGAGRPDIQERLKTMEGTFVGRCRVVDGYNVNVAHIMMGGADMLLIPSHYHPNNALCAIGMRYGVVPIIYSQSGLEDYVVDMESDPESGTGIHFRNYSGDGLVEGIDAARKIYKDPDSWKALVRRCLRQDFSWQATAREYLKAYRRVTRRVRSKKKSA